MNVRWVGRRVEDSRVGGDVEEALSLLVVEGERD